LAVSTHQSQLPELVTAVPGPRSRALAERLGQVEGRNVTCLAPTPPIFWERARASNVWDVDGNRYIDLSAAFGVANTGHAHPNVVAAVADQAERLLHGMGDVHPSAVKVELLEALVQLFPGGGPARAVLSSSGSDAVETAIKTATLASGNAGIVAFEGGYHGLGLGALDTTSRGDFRAPFQARLPHATVFARFGDLDDVERAARECTEPIGAVIVEPVQGRGGERLPPDGFLSGLRACCDERGWLLIVDEIFTGFGRTGHWFACERDGVVPDLICLGKGMASGMPISACVGRRDVMDAWPASSGEAIHTQTFLGHPPSCAAALAAIHTIESLRLVERAAENGASALARLRGLLAGRADIVEVRGRGLILAVECASAEQAAIACGRALVAGVITLVSGDDGRVVSITPPLSIEPEILLHAIDIVAESLS
jgi:4-aminobutyrate aminotransferase/(S)-3-amino-2-methylpropionate transaminase